MRLLLLSNSRCEGMGYLEHAKPWIADILRGEVTRALFVPFAAVTRSFDWYAEQVAGAFAELAVEIESIHPCDDPVAAVNAAQAVVIGGGNTWQLLRELRRRDLLPALRARVREGMPYLGWSAGSNMACPTIMTTNDMPICDPGGFEALWLVPFQINPHYLHGNPPGFKGETREQRITEFCAIHQKTWVAGLREGTGFVVEDEAIRLLGEHTCRVFHHGIDPQERAAADDFGFLLKPLRGQTPKEENLGV